MIYWNAKQLVETAMANQIIPVSTPGMEGTDSHTGEKYAVQSGMPIVYMVPKAPDFKEGWYVRDKEELIYELMEDEEGQKLLTERLTAIGKMPELLDPELLDESLRV